jgi:threonine aldolase
VYTKSELIELHHICKNHHLPLFIDGARLGYSLATKEAVSLSDIASLCDVFYFGGTKTGALFGEAVVITNEGLQKDFTYLIKQKGGLLAKGRLLGIQFKVLFENHLYNTLASHAVGLAVKIRRAFEEHGFQMRYDSLTNQQFPILPADAVDVLKEKYAFQLWEKQDDGNVTIRLCTSWATKEADVEELIMDIGTLVK